MKKGEKSPSGNPIYRYDDIGPSKFEPVTGGDNIETISDHIEKHIGPIHTVFHELVSDKVHIDVHWVRPSVDFPFHTLVSSGMSDLPMNIPEGVEASPFTELCILLPADWKMPIDDKDSKEVFENENNYWPVRWLKILAKFPHDYKTWLSWGHTIPNSESADPFAENTELACMLLLPGINLPPEFFELEVDEEKTIQFYTLIPIYKEEMDFKLAKGTDALIRKFDKYEVSAIVDLNRKNTCKKGRLFGLF